MAASPISGELLMNDGLFALTSQYVIQSGILNVKGKHFLFFFEFDVSMSRF